LHKSAFRACLPNTRRFGVMSVCSQDKEGFLPLAMKSREMVWLSKTGDSYGEKKARFDRSAMPFERR
jgi:hypothetical protein